MAQNMKKALPESRGGNDFRRDAQAAAALVSSHGVRHQPPPGRQRPSAAGPAPATQLPDRLGVATQAAARHGAEDPLCGTIEVGTAELLGTGEFLDFEWHGLIIIGAEVDGTRIGRVRMRPVRNALPRYLHAFVEQCVVSGSAIRTDDWHGYVGLAQKGYPHEALPYWRNWDLDEDLPGRPKYSEMPRVDWVAERLKRWLVGTHAGAVSQTQSALLLRRVHVPIQRAPRGPWEALRASPAASGSLSSAARQMSG